MIVTAAAQAMLGRPWLIILYLLLDQYLNLAVLVPGKQKLIIQRT